MSDYGTHATRYGDLPNDDLYSMYRSYVYGNLNEGEKLELLQETVNRDALERGEIGSPLVEFASLSANVSGEAGNGIIRVNYDMAVDGKQLFEYNGRIMEHRMDDYNIQSLNTVLHENIHCFQEQVIDGTIEISESQLAAQYQANNFEISTVLQDGSYQLGSQYLTGETASGYYMYYLQATERDAFRLAEQKTDRILQDLSMKYGAEPSFKAYAKGIEVNGYRAMEQQAVQLFNNPNFERDLNQVLQNQYFGMNVPVNINTENAVKNEMTATYKALQQQMTQCNHYEVEGKGMGFSPKPVSLEQYNQTLKDSVTHYYEYAANNPAMSREEVISSTGQMAENALNAVDDFRVAQDVQIETENTEIAAEGSLDVGNDFDEVGEECDSGMEV